MLGSRPLKFLGSESDWSDCADAILGTIIELIVDYHTHRGSNYTEIWKHKLWSCTCKNYQAIMTNDADNKGKMRHDTQHRTRHALIDIVERWKASTHIFNSHPTQKYTINKMRLHQRVVNLI